MIVKNVSCPNPAVLREYARGGVAPDKAKELAQHLDECQSCFTQVALQWNSLADTEPQASLTVGAGGARTSGQPRSDVGKPTADGRFAVLRLHDQGGLGEVFLAMDSDLNRKVALKRIRETHADNPDCQQRFMIEAEITGGLEHPGIVPVYCLGHFDDDRPYYAMRFIRGDSLKDLIEQPTGRCLPRARFAFSAVRTPG